MMGSQWEGTKSRNMGDVWRTNSLCRKVICRLFKVLEILVMSFLQILSRRSHSRIGSRKERRVLCTWKGRGCRRGIGSGVVKLIARDRGRKIRGLALSLV